MQLPVSFPDPFVGPPMFFLKYKKKRKKGRVKLCGIKKKNIWYIFNLHKLPVKVRKTGEDKCRNICKGDSFAKQFLLDVYKRQVLHQIILMILMMIMMTILKMISRMTLKTKISNYHIQLEV